MYVTTFHIHTYIRTYVRTYIDEATQTDCIRACKHSQTDRQTDSKKGKKRARYLIRFNSQCCHTLPAEIKVTGIEREREREREREGERDELMYDLRFYFLFRSISVILGRWEGDNTGLCIQKIGLRLRLNSFPPPAVSNRDR